MVAARLDDLERMRRAQRFAELTTALPPLLHHLFARGQSTEPATENGDRGRAMAHDAYRLSANVGRHFRHADIAATASERHIALAPTTGDPLRVALSEWHRSAHFLQNGLYGAGSRVLDRALAQVAMFPSTPQPAAWQRSCTSGQPSWPLAVVTATAPTTTSGRRTS